ncbi:hypothetical protein A2U01_0000461, partial [Trifolium medium]|nr:hypothetical protein [Trifolium medium]
MADNTRMKEIYAELKKNAESIETVSSTLSEQIDRLELGGSAQMMRMEEIQRSNETQFSQINANIAQLLQRFPASSSSYHGAKNSGLEQPRNSFQ